MLLRNIYKFSFTYPCPRRLREIMKLSIIEREPAPSIIDIWNQYHAHRTENISSILTKEEYQHIRDCSNRAPMFLLPLRRQGGHFKLLSQWQTNSYLFTYLEDYKRLGVNAHPYFVITLFTELLFTKGIVLVRGDIISYKISKPEAEATLKEIKALYMQPEKYEMAVNFNHNTSQFSETKYNEMYRL